MALELLEDQATAITLSPLGLDARPVSATVEFRKPGSTSATASGSATIGSWSTTISSVSNQTQFVVASASNLSQGLRVWITASDGWQGPALISEIEGTTITLEAALPGTLAASDTIHPYELTFNLTSSDTALRDLNYKALWTVTDADGNKTINQQMYHVCRTLFAPSVTSDMASRYILKQFPGMAGQMTAGHFEEMAKRASDRVRSRIQGAGAYPHLVGDPSVFQIDCGIHSLRLECAFEGLYPPGFDASDYSADQARALERSIHDALRSMQWIDNDDSGTVTAGEVKTTFTIPATRGGGGRVSFESRQLRER
tara:strand:+ start:62 stop:1000 length:939 start_codon:yes stop_codon:yes gene_type:complete